MYPTQVSEQPTQKISEIFSINLDIGAENTPQNSSLSQRERMWKNFLNISFISKSILIWRNKGFSKRWKFKIKLSKKFFHILALHAKPEFWEIVPANKNRFVLKICEIYCVGSSETCVGYTCFCVPYTVSWIALTEYQ